MSKSPYVWSSDVPHREGHWWHREDKTDENPCIVKVYLSPTGWSVRYNDLGDESEDEDACVDFIENWLHDGRAQWAFIPKPRDP